jgi:hypothetical protein
MLAETPLCLSPWGQYRSPVSTTRRNAVREHGTFGGRRQSRQAPRSRRRLCCLSFPRRAVCVLTSIKDADCNGIKRCCDSRIFAHAPIARSPLIGRAPTRDFLSTLKRPLRRTLTMIRLTTALLTLGVSMATATTALGQGQDGCFYGSCNPEASWCRLLCGSDPQQQNVRSPWAPGYVAATHHRSMYMYVPRHGSGTHMHKKAPLKKAP